MATPAEDLNNDTSHKDLNNDNSQKDFDFTFQPLPLSNIVNYIFVKLGCETNYLVSKDQMEFILISTDLFGFIDGSIPPPSPSILVGDKEVLNPVYVK